MKTTVLAASVAAILFSQPVFAHQAGDFIARAGSVTVRPSESSDDVFGAGRVQCQQ